MDYETGIASSPSDLLSKLATFAGANGWTINSPSSGAVYVKDTVVVGVNSDADEVFARGAIGYNAGAAWDAQNDNSGVTTKMILGAGPFTAYHFFVGDENGADYLNVVVEYAAGKYRHMAFGELVKYGTFTGGTYVDSVDWTTSTTFMNNPENTFSQVICDTVGSGNGHVWGDIDSKTNNWQRVLSANELGSTRALGSAREDGLVQMFPNVGYQRWNLRNMLAPLTYYMNRGSSLRSPVGRIPNMRLVGLQNLIPGEELIVGGVTWKCFPIVQRTEVFDQSPSSIESSGYYGYAYRIP